LLPVQQRDLALTGIEEAKNAPALQIGKRARNRLQRQSQIVRDIAAAHRQRHDVGGRQATVHFEQEGGDALQRALAAQQQHVILGVLQVVRGQAE
jgi:hypothetical protein